MLYWQKSFVTASRKTFHSNLWFQLKSLLSTFKLSWHCVEQAKVDFNKTTSSEEKKLSTVLFYVSCMRHKFLIIFLCPKPSLSVGSFRSQPVRRVLLFNNESPPTRSSKLINCVYPMVILAFLAVSPHRSQFASLLLSHIKILATILDHDCIDPVTWCTQVSSKPYLCVSVFSLPCSSDDLKAKASASFFR